ncbi:hypothetical protein EPO44_20090 [bacterium]|nr:MAG: hypothetical protein EPO44_20090 [bacterium]
MKDYRSFEMFTAIRSLWEFKKKHTGNIGEAYEQARKAEDEAAASLPRAQREETERASLHFKRRQVSQFYQLLGGLYDLKIIPKGVLFTYWTKIDLSIIPDILVPVEKSLAGDLWKKPVVADSVERMLRLYNDAPPDQTA